MTDKIAQENPTDRLRIPVTKNALIDASRFCIEQCGFFAEAQEMALVSTVMATKQPAVARWEGDDVPEIDTVGQVPNIVLKCKGPQKRFIAFGDYVCRKSASMDTE